ncbi:MAG: cytochrome c biogenesis protein ResB [Alphaproteobacteria bacterium]|nr:cytochrome c biogenesis protein ResB [Alphaproteobacteria bacterium]
MLETIRNTANRLAQPDILFWVLPMMMALIVLGTVAQKSIGLFAAQQEYFGSFFLMLGPIPIPAGLSIMGVFLINLLCKFVMKSEWTWQKSGTIISHFGVLLLVFGGLMTALTSKEGFVMIPQGGSSTIVEDYHSRNLAIRSETETLLTIPHEHLENGMTVSDPKIPFTLNVDKYCFNCTITSRPENLQQGWERPGIFMMLNKAPAESQDEKNLTGIEFSITGTHGVDGKYLTFDGFPKPPTLVVNDKPYTITIERARRELPFSIELKEFKRALHPGTDMASAFMSQIIINDKEQGVSFPATIEMNEPLRYRGFTLYQSSFDLNGEVPYTILAVVENKGRLFPYIASILIALGLIIHLGLRIANRIKSRTEENAA